jgi:hypothetical protein
VVPGAAGDHADREPTRRGHLVRYSTRTIALVVAISLLTVLWMVMVVPALIAHPEVSLPGAPN